MLMVMLLDFKMIDYCDNLWRRSLRRACGVHVRSPSYSRGGGAVVDQAVQHPQQVVLPGQVTKPLLHHMGKQGVLQILQREDVLPCGEREVAPIILGGAS